MPFRPKPVLYGPQWLIRRETGLRLPIGSALAQRYQWSTSYDYNLLYAEGAYHGIFNLEYTPDGSLLLATTEHNSILFYDPLRQKLLSVLANAHQGCINFVKFIDNNVFATSSDDTTVVLWDLRNTSQKLHQLHGHDNWVKNVDKAGDHLVTSGFDGSVITWNLKENPIIPNTRLRLRGLMRTRVSADSSKLVASTASGYLVVIHNLDFDNWSEDFSSFEPNKYRLIQICKAPIETIIPYSHMFKDYGKKNRVEFISDFPKTNEAEVISSLVIHPDGNHIITRNTSKMENNEFTCLHSILELQDDEGEIFDEKRWPKKIKKSTEPTGVIPPANRPTAGNNRPNRQNDIWEAYITVHDDFLIQRSAGNNQPMPELDEQPVIENANEDGRDPEDRYDGKIFLFEGEIVCRLIGGLSVADNMEMLFADRNMNGPVNPMRISLNHCYFSRCDEVDERIHKNKRKLISWIQEPNVGLGYIKEQSFSKDGSLICSPYETSIRILSLSSDLRDPWQCNFSKNPPNLNVVKELLALDKGSSDHFVCAKFSPIDHQIVAGTLKGKIAIFNPLRE